jgi:hypothetical protein
MDTTAETPTYDVIEYLKTTQLDWNNTIRICPINTGRLLKSTTGTR